jgi:hypothetical protein
MTEIDEELAALYRTARAQEAPMGEDRRAVQAAVAAALATAVTTSAHAAGGAAASQAVTAVATGKVAAWLCGGMAIGAALAGGAWLVTSPPEPPRPNVSTIPAVRSGSRPPPPPPASTAFAPAPAPSLSSSVALETVSDKPGATRRVPPGTSGARITVGAGSSLLAESESVQAIQRALAAGRTSQALSLLAEQDILFGGGALAEERAALRVLALCAAGQPDAAEAARLRFLSAYPQSPHRARVLEKCTK